MHAWRKEIAAALGFLGIASLVLYALASYATKTNAFPQFMDRWWPVSVALIIVAACLFRGAFDPRARR